jgi:hypothetical protein
MQPELFKLCTVCGKLKSLSDFANCSAKKDGKKHGCKQCYGKVEREYREKKKRHRAGVKKDWRNRNLEHVKAIKRKYREEHPDRIQAYARRYRREREQRDIGYRLRNLLRSRLKSAIGRQYGKKAMLTVELIGCSIEKCRRHIENQFRPGMSWNNLGNKGWHVDHIIPLAKFDLIQPSEQKVAFHFMNLQPLWWYENLKKGDRLSPKYFPNATHPGKAFAEKALHAS